MARELPLAYMDAIHHQLGHSPFKDLDTQNIGHHHHCSLSFLLVICRTCAFLQYSIQLQCCPDIVALANAALLLTYQLHNAIALS